MFGFKNKAKEEVKVVDSWMRENFIPVHPSTSVKMLKPYQRMVILRKPEGEKKCIIDISLPYDEIEMLKEQLSEDNYPNVFDKNLLRIIPQASEIERRFKNISKLDMEAIAQMLNDNFFSGGDAELDQMLVANTENTNVVSTIKMQDNKTNVSLKEEDKKQPQQVDKEIDSIDEDIKIPLEEVYNQKWNDFDGYLNNLDNALNEKGSNKAIDLISEMADSDNNQDQNVDSNSEVALDENVDYEPDYLDANNSGTTDSQSSSLSFFKEESANYSNINSTGRVYKKVNFYTTDPNAEYEKVVLNKKKKMFMYRRKLDKSLLK